MIVPPPCLYAAARQWHVSQTALVRRYDAGIAALADNTGKTATTIPIITLHTQKDLSAHERTLRYLRLAQAQYLAQYKAHKAPNAASKVPGGVGVMGIPSPWIPVLVKNGFSRQQLASNVCANIQAEALIMAVEAQAKRAQSPSMSSDASAAKHPVAPAPACLRQAAQAYGVSYHLADAYYTHAQNDNGESGSSDVGPMRIPGSWLPLLRYAGFPEWQVKHDTCWNIAAGIWILSAEHRFQGKTGEGWTASAITAGIPSIPGNVIQDAAAASAQTGVPENLLMAVAWQESGFNPNAVSYAGAQGLMQFMPSTWSVYGHGSPFNPREAMLAGAKYLRHLALRFHSWPLALAGYNAGGGAVERAGDAIPPYAQTQAYVPAVLGRYAKLAGESSNQP